MRTANGDIGDKDVQSKRSFNGALVDFLGFSVAFQDDGLTGGLDNDLVASLVAGLADEPVLSLALKFASRTLLECIKWETHKD
jgi:hypothetical protein